MTTNAGEMSSSVQANPQWVAADGKPYYTLYWNQPRRTHSGISYGDRRDYVRRVGRRGRSLGIGPLGWIFCVPYDATSTYKVTTADDTSETALVPPITTTTTASVAANGTVIPVTSATGMAAGMPIAATGIPPNAAIISIAALNLTIAPPVLAGGVASGATVTVTPPGPPSVAKPPAGIK